MIYNAARVRRLSTKFQVHSCKSKKDRYAHAHLVVEIQVMIYDVARVRRLCTKLQVSMSKNKNFHFGGHFLGGVGLDCSQCQILTDPHNGQKNLCMQFGNDRSHRHGGVW